MLRQTVYAKFFINNFLNYVNDLKNEILVKSYCDLIGYTSLWVQ